MPPRSKCVLCVCPPSHPVFKKYAALPLAGAGSPPTERHEFRQADSPSVGFGPLTPVKDHLAVEDHPAARPVERCHPSKDRAT